MENKDELRRRVDKVMERSGTIYKEHPTSTSPGG